MASAIPQKQQTAFYAPAYRLKFANKELQEERGDILSVQFKDSIKDLSALEIVLNNLDDDGKRQPRFKYSDGGTDVELGKSFTVEMGYSDTPALTFMMGGEVTAFDPHFPSSGTPTVTVRGLDRLHQLRNRPGRKSWPDDSDSGIAEKIAQANGLGAAVVDDTVVKYPVIPQDNRDDLSFLVERAKRLDYEVYMRPVKEGTEHVDRLHFVRTREGKAPVLRLALGDLLESFEPSLTLSRMVSKVTVRSWHPDEGRLIVKSADRTKLRELAPEGKDAAGVIEELLGKGKEEVITNQAALSDGDAEKLAVSVLRRNAHSFVTGQGTTVGIPALRAGVNIELQGLGARFNGSYYVTESTHRIDQSGYKTSFSARKAYIGGKNAAG